MKFFESIGVCILCGLLVSGCTGTPSQIRDIAEKPGNYGRMHLDGSPEDGYVDFRYESQTADAAPAVPAESVSGYG